MDGQALEDNPAGLSKVAINDLFHGHVESARIDAALEQLASLGNISCRTQATGGRPRTTWEAAPEEEELLQD